MKATKNQADQETGTDNCAGEPKEVPRLGFSYGFATYWPSMDVRHYENDGDTKPVGVAKR